MLEDPRGIAAVLGLTVMVKSGMLTWTGTKRISVPLVALTVRVYVPVDVVPVAVTVTVTLAFPLAGRVTVTVAPVAVELVSDIPGGLVGEGEIDSVTLIFPENPFRLVAVTL